MNPRFYTIKQASERSGVSIDTLRYYERIGLMPAVERARNGHRRYTGLDLGWLHLLNLLRNTGMSIQQMQTFVKLEQQGAKALPSQLEILKNHRATLLLHIKDLETSVGLLDEKIAYYAGLVEQIPKPLPLKPVPRRKLPAPRQRSRARPRVPTR
jgi:DNA-binding transcriptional MerR regulator